MKEATIRKKIEQRMDDLENSLKMQTHLKAPTAVGDMIESISKFYSILTEDQREFVQCARLAVLERKRSMNPILFRV
jgi:hypothetical protein